MPDRQATFTLDHPIAEALLVGSEAAAAAEGHKAVLELAQVVQRLRLYLLGRHAVPRPAAGDNG